MKPRRKTKAKRNVEREDALALLLCREEGGREVLRYQEDPRLPEVFHTFPVAGFLPKKIINRLKHIEKHGQQS